MDDNAYEIWNMINLNALKPLHTIVLRKEFVRLIRNCHKVGREESISSELRRVYIRSVIQRHFSASMPRASSERGDNHVHIYEF
jgi:hypothetical protein